MSRAKNFEIAFKLGSKLDPSVQKNFNAANNQLGNMRKNIGNAIKAGAKLAIGVVAAGAAAAGAAVAMANRFASTADEIDKASIRAGVHSDTLQELRYAMGQVGVDQSTLETALQRTNQRLGEAAAGNEKYQKALVRLGFSIDDVKNGQLDNDEVFMKSIDTLNKMENSQEAAALAAELFGTKTAQELLPAIKAGTLSIEDLRKEANDLNHVIGEDGIKAGVLWADTMDKGKKAIGGLFNTVAGSALPVMQKFLDYGISKLPMLQDKVSTAMGVAGNVIGWLGDKGMSVFNNIRNAIQDNQPTIQRLQDVAIDLGGHMKGIFESAQPYIKWFANEGIPKAVDVLSGLLDGAVNTYNFIKDNWSWIAPIVGGITGALIAYRTVTQSIILVKGALAAAQIAWNIAMTANPIGLIIVGIGALIGIGYLLIKNYKAVGAFFVGLWNSFIGWVSPVGKAITGTFTSAYNAVTGLFGGIGSWFTNILSSVTGAFRGGINNVIKIANSAIGSLNGISVSIPDWVPKYGGRTFGVNIPKIPMLAQGGITTGATLAMIGEGSEQEAVLPLSKLNSLLGITEKKETKNVNNQNSNDNITNNVSNGQSVDNSISNEVFSETVNNIGATSSDVNNEINDIKTNSAHTVDNKNSDVSNENNEQYYNEQNDTTTTNNNDNGQSIQITYSPQYIISDNTKKEEIEKVSKQDYQEFKRFIKRYFSEKDRVSFV
ncbi:hypothetical protein RJD24_18585 [Bacillaceae bacterium IKA-2]|nr:hypothetical protein RJD24_18585 [Bacillaceae bacterium IKA-2]